MVWVFQTLNGVGVNRTYIFNELPKCRYLNLPRDAEDLKVRFHEHTVVSFCLDPFVNILMDALEALEEEAKVSCV